ncbi:MAG TPA: hypothetical protein VES20_12595, partial [Bryobacteraceae bacterium]|nr:hypothetical protein [Bryobacteraceae bacterium]
SHLVFALSTTAYILAAIPLEEADLAREHSQYAAYRREVPMLIPRLASRRAIRHNDAAGRLANRATERKSIAAKSGSR